jgi:carboxypeptidase Taq
MTLKEAYEQLSEHGKQLAYLGSAIAVLDWDQRTQIPPKGHAHRVNQLACLAGMRHRMVTDPIVGERLASIEGSELVRDPESVEAVNVRWWRRYYDRAIKIPEKLAVALSRAAAEGQSVWERARPKNDWDLFKPYLERIVSLKREEAQAVGYEQEPYDALLDVYEVGETARNLEPIFERLRKALVELIERIQARSERRASAAVHRLFPIEDQRSFSLEVARRIGYDLEAGRLDTSAHPFTTGIGPGDVRITTRYSENYFNEAFFAVIHEAGHAMYHQGLPLEHWGAPICRPISLGVNESQSRMWENMVARSEAFWRHFYPKAQYRFASLAEVPLSTFLLAVNEVKPSLIRVEADEVTYNLHILLRFELEVALIRGAIQANDLPDAWNDKMLKYLGLRPPNYAQGVMQDVHWSSGSIGYFPTYTLGNLYAAQLFHRAKKDLGDLDSFVSGGEFAPLLEWLRKKIHSHGSTYLPRELLIRATGEDLSPGFLIDYLKTKYHELYAI